MLLVAVLIGALVATDIGSTLSNSIERAICEITGGDCENELADADDRCLLRSETSEASLSVKIKVIRVGTSSTLIRQDFSDDTSDATLINDAELSAELQEGVDANGPGFTLSKSRKLAAGGRLADADVYENLSDEEADAIEADAASGSGDGVARNVADISDYTSPLSAGLKGLTGFSPANGLLDLVGVDDDDDLPDPDSEYVEGEVFGSGEFTDGLEAGPASEELAATLDGAVGARRINSGDDEGDIEAFISLEGELAADFNAAVLGGGANGNLEGVATVTIDGETGEPSELSLTGDLTVAGGGDFGLDATESLLNDAAVSELEGLVAERTSDQGVSLEVDATLDLTEGDNAEVALGALTDGPVGGGRLLERLARDGQVTASAYGERIEGTEAGFDSPAAGAEAGSETTESELLVSYIKDEDASGFRRRACE